MLLLLPWWWAATVLWTGSWRGRGRRGRGLLLKSLLQVLKLLLEVADEPQHPRAGLLCRIDCVPVHAALVINAYPRGTAPGTVGGFWLAPPMPSRAKVLRARLPVIGRRAYGLTVH